MQVEYSNSDQLQNQSPEKIIPAKLRKRIAAFVIDLIFLSFIFILVYTFFGFILGLFVLGTLGMIGLFYDVIYPLIILISGYIAIRIYTINRLHDGFFTSPGKRYLKIKVMSSGGKLKYYTILYRETIGKLISLIPICLGFMFIFINKNHRGFHDIISETIVVEDAGFAGGQIAFAGDKKNYWHYFRILSVVVFVLFIVIFEFSLFNQLLSIARGGPDIKFVEAVRSGDPKLCNNIFNLTLLNSKIDDKTVCLITMANMKNDLSICQLIKKDDYQKKCMTSVENIKLRQAQRESNEMLCENIDEVSIRDECYKSIAKIKKEPKLCDKVNFEKIRKECVESLYIYQVDTEACSQFSGTRNAECLASNAIKHKDFNHCKSGSSTPEQILYCSDTYYAAMAINEHNSSFCKKIHDVRRLNNCHFHFMKDNPGYIDRAHGVTERDNGYYRASIELHDPIYCLKIEIQDTRLSCIKSFKELSFCEMLKEDYLRDKCYFEIVVKTYKNGDM